MAEDLDLRQFERRYRSEAALALGQFGEIILGGAQRRAPIAEGTLRGSGRSELIVVGDEASAQISFSTPYAARQHEETEWQHLKGGESKYLENQVKARAHDLPRFMAARLGKLF